MGALRSPTRSHDVARPCRAVGGLPCAACPAPRACGEHGTRAGAPEAGIARPRRSRLGLVWPVAAFPRPSALPPSGRGVRARRQERAGRCRRERAVCAWTRAGAGGAPLVPLSRPPVVGWHGALCGVALCASPTCAGVGSNVQTVARLSQRVSHGRRGRGPQHEPAPPCQARLPRAQRSEPRVCPGVARRRGRPRASGAWAGRESGAQRGRTRACRRLEIASAHASLRLFPAPEAER